uniref:Sodium/calcium exchanger membrane region domain-containing protein n=1 Tax=Quercus lobata TaxID=97700 RepID=A0A7N2MAW6_QUELO
MRSNITKLASLILTLSIVILEVHGRRSLRYKSSDELVSDGVHQADESSSLLLLKGMDSGEECEQLYGFLPCSNSMFGHIFLIVVYEYLLFKGESLVAAGGEQIFKILGPGIFGASAFHVLGALPESLILLASGLLNTKETAQEYVFTGVGLLAGSSIFLLTILWGTCVIASSQDFSNSSQFSNSTQTSRQRLHTLLTGTTCGDYVKDRGAHHLYPSTRPSVLRYANEETSNHSFVGFYSSHVHPSETLSRWILRIARGRACGQKMYPIRRDSIDGTVSHCERMSGGSKATSDHVLSLRLDDKDAHLSRNVPLTEEWMGSLKRESSAHLLEDEMEGEIPDDVPIRMAGKREKCYSGRTADVVFYEAVLMACLSISEEEFEFLQRILAIPLVQRSWKRLVTFDSLHAFVANQIQWIRQGGYTLNPNDVKMDLGTKRALEVKKAASLQLKAGSSQGFNDGSQPIINEFVALAVPLLVKDKQHAVQTAYSIVKDLDLEKCSEHKTEALGDFGLFDLIRVIYSKSQFYSVIHRQALKCRLEEESDQLKKYKEGTRTLHSKVKALTKQVKKLDGATHRDKELTKANSILTTGVTSLRKSMDKAKADAVEEYKDSHPFFNLLGSQYGEGF